MHAMSTTPTLRALADAYLDLWERQATAAISAPELADVLYHFTSTLNQTDAAEGRADTTSADTTSADTMSADTTPAESSRAEE